VFVRVRTRVAVREVLLRPLLLGLPAAQQRSEARQVDAEKRTDERENQRQPTTGTDTDRRVAPALADLARVDLRIRIKSHGITVPWSARYEDGSFTATSASTSSTLAP